MKKEYGYPTLKVICQASAGNETAIREILKLYDAYICKLCLRPECETFSVNNVLEGLLW